MESSSFNDRPTPALPEVTRRNVLRVAGLGALAVPFSGLLAGCGGGKGGAGAASKELVYANFGGTYEQKIVQAQISPFEKSSGVTVKLTQTASQVAQMKTMVAAKRTEWDLIDATGPVYGQLLADDLLDKMDKSIVSADGIANQAAVSDYGIPQYAYAHCIFWNADKFKQGMESWADVWDVKRFPGKRAFQKNPYYLLEAALLADGVDPKGIYPLDLKRAISMLDKIRPNAVFQNLNTIQNLVAQGDVVTGDLNLARVKQLISDGTNLKYTWNQNIIDYERWVVLKGAPNKENAMKLIASSLKPDRQTAVLDLLGYTPTLTAALSKIPADKRADIAGTDETLGTAVVLDPDYYAKHGAEAAQAVREWLVQS
jgi:putative spermidine/putrescine transport system substrate-binding protein